MTFLASYPGICVACGDRFGGGAEIESVGDRSDRAYAHAVCPPSTLEQQRPACPSCFLELPVSGVCEECS